MISPIEMFAAFSTVFSKHQYGPQCSTKQRERHDLAFEGHSIVSKHFAYWKYYWWKITRWNLYEVKEEAVTL